MDLKQLIELFLFWDGLRIISLNFWKQNLIIQETYNQFRNLRWFDRRNLTISSMTSLLKKFKKGNFPHLRNLWFSQHLQYFFSLCVLSSVPAFNSQTYGQQLLADHTKPSFSSKVDPDLLSPFRQTLADYPRPVLRLHAGRSKDQAPMAWQPIDLVWIGMAGAHCGVSN